MNKFLLIALFFFFLNAAGLPQGLTYMALLTPLLYVWIVCHRQREILWPFLLLLFPFIVLHLAVNDASFKPYFVSLANLVAIYVFCQAFILFLSRARNLETIFYRLLQINFILCLIALPFYFSSSFSIFWIEQELTKGVNGFRRLRMFTYEASYYATLFVPLFTFFFLHYFLPGGGRRSPVLLPMVTLPLLLSFSLGVMSALLLALVLLFLFHFRRLVLQPRVQVGMLFSTLVLFPVLLLLAASFPGNALFFRLENVFSGQDTSGNGRTFEAFTLSMRMLQLKSRLWGIGLGQIKPLGTEIIRDYYLYPMDHTIFAIPNAAAETLTVFGFAGLFLRLSVQLFLFFYTRVWTSYYRLTLFFFVFIYQFTGSFITNHAEYVIWILAFTEVFPRFSIAKTNSL